MRPFLALTAALLVASPLLAQRTEQPPRRPRLAAGADTNDAVAYLAHGTRTLEQDAQEAADAFYWAWRLDPGSADAIYGRRTALLMRKPVVLKLYMEGGRRARQNKELIAIDSLRVRAFRMDPFLYARFDRTMLMGYYRNMLRGSASGLSQQEMDMAIDDYLQTAGAATRGWLYYSQGRMADAITMYDMAIKRSREPAYLRVDKARTLFMQGMNLLAKQELELALTDLRKDEDDEEEEVGFYDSKSVLEHGLGVLHTKLGHVDSAKAAFGRAMEEDLSYFPAHIELGRLALAARDTGTAVAEMGLAAELAGEEAWVQQLHGSTLIAAGRAEEALDPLRKAIALEPFFAAPYFALGQALERTNDAAGARKAYADFLARASRRDAARSVATQRLTALGGAP